MRKFVYCILCCLSLTACKWNRLDMLQDQNGVEIARYDHLQFEYATSNSVTALQKMNTEYPQATKLLIEDVLGIGRVNDPQINEKLLVYLSDTTIQHLLLDVEEKFRDIRWIENDLDKGLSYLKKELPDLVVPQFYAQISALNQSVVVRDSLVGFSLDKYMGKDYALYKRFYYDYQTKYMSPDRIVPDCLTFYLISEYPMTLNRRRTLLDVMLYRGRFAWLLTKALEYDSIEDMMGYDAEEKKWCQKNKQKVWQFMQDNHHLDMSDPMIIRSYMGMIPYYTIMDENAPQGVGLWIGAQLVEEYMREHKEVSIQELMDLTNYRKIVMD